MQIQYPTDNQPSNVFAAATSGSTPTGTTTNSASTPTSLATEDTFLKLMVAQLKNQDPTQPTDGTQFLTQLAQFSQLEQLININAELKPQTPSAATGSGNSTGATAA